MLHGLGFQISFKNIIGTPNKISLLDSFPRHFSSHKIMEDIYHLISDNITELMLIFSSSKQSLHISSSCKHLSHHIYLFSNISVRQNKSFQAFDKLINIRQLQFYQSNSDNILRSLSTLSTLQNLSIYYDQNDIHEYIELKKLTIASNKKDDNIITRCNVIKEKLIIEEALKKYAVLIE